MSRIGWVWGVWAMSRCSFGTSWWFLPLWTLVRLVLMRISNSISSSHPQYWSQTPPPYSHDSHNSLQPCSSQTLSHYYSGSSSSSYLTTQFPGSCLKIVACKALAEILSSDFRCLNPKDNIGIGFGFLEIQEVMVRDYYHLLIRVRWSWVFERIGLCLGIWDKRICYTETLLGRMFSLLDGKNCICGGRRWFYWICGRSLGECDRLGVTCLSFLMKKLSSSFILLGWNIWLVFR